MICDGTLEPSSPIFLGGRVDPELFEYNLDPALKDPL